MMSLSRFKLLYVYLLVVMVTAAAEADRYFPLTIGRKQNSSSKNSSFYQHEEQKPEIKPLFAKKLNEIQTLADLASVMINKDRRFCTNVTLRNIEEVSNNTTGRNLQYINRTQESLKKLKEHCAQIKRGRGLLMTVSDLPLAEVTKMNYATKEFVKGSCKPKVVQYELPVARDGFRYLPQCVMLKQCGGCCNSRLLQCKPAKMTNVTKWVFKLDIHSKNQAEKVVPTPITLQQHDRCKCDCKVLASNCTMAQLYDENNCECKCLNESDSADCGKFKKWDPTQCSCVCKPSLLCSTGAFIDPTTCKCIRKNNKFKNKNRRTKRRL